MNEYAGKIKTSGVTVTHLCEVLTEKTGKKVYPSYMQRCLTGKADTLAAQTLVILAEQYCDALKKATDEFMRKK